MVRRPCRAEDVRRKLVLGQRSTWATQYESPWLPPPQICGAASSSQQVTPRTTTKHTYRSSSSNDINIVQFHPGRLMTRLHRYDLLLQVQSWQIVCQFMISSTPWLTADSGSAHGTRVSYEDGGGVAQLSPERHSRSMWIKRDRRVIEFPPGDDVTDTIMTTTVRTLYRLLESSYRTSFLLEEGNTRTLRM